LEDRPGYRASRAFAPGPGSGPRTGWIGFDGGAAPAPWISWTSPRPLRVQRLRLAPSAAAVRRPTRVGVSWPGGQTGSLQVRSGGDVSLPRPVRARSFRITILQAASAAGATLRQRHIPAVGIGAGVQHVTSLPGPFSVDLLRLASPAPVAAPAPGGRVLSAGRVGDSSLDGVKLSVRTPSWLVLGESYDAGWRATCNGRSLGAP